MYDLIVGEYQHKVLTVGVKHAEGQLPVMLVAEIRITLHVSGKIIHPAHIPLIIKAQAVLLHRTGDLRPCGRFLCDEKPPLISFLKMLFKCFRNSTASRFSWPP